MSGIEALLEHMEFWSIWRARLRWEEGFPDTWQIIISDGSSHPPSATGKVVPNLLPWPEQTRDSAATVVITEAADSY